VSKKKDALGREESGQNRGGAPTRKRSRLPISIRRGVCLLADKKEGGGKEQPQKERKSYTLHDEKSWSHNQLLRLDDQAGGRGRRTRESPAAPERVAHTAARGSVRAGKSLGESVARIENSVNLGGCSSKNSDGIGHKRVYSRPIWSLKRRPGG